MIVLAQGEGHETPAEQPPFHYKDPDTECISPHPNEEDLGLDDEPTCDDDSLDSDAGD